MSLVSLTQERQIHILFGIVGTITAVTTISLYLQKRKHKKADDLIRTMELEIKSLELSKLRNEKKT